MPISPRQRWKKWKIIKECQINMHTYYSYFCVYHVKPLKYYYPFCGSYEFILITYSKQTTWKTFGFSYFPFQISLSRKWSQWSWIGTLYILDRFLGSWPSSATAQISDSCLELIQKHLKATFYLTMVISGSHRSGSSQQG